MSQCRDFRPSEARKMAYQCVHSFVCGLTSLKPIVDLVRPRAHLYRSDEILVHVRFFVKMRQQDIEMIPDESRLVTCCRVECRHGQSAHRLNHGASANGDASRL